MLLRAWAIVFIAAVAEVSGDELFMYALIVLCLDMFQNCAKTQQILFNDFKWITVRKLKIVLTFSFFSLWTSAHLHKFAKTTVVALSAELINWYSPVVVKSWYTENKKGYSHSSIIFLISHLSASCSIARVSGGDRPSARAHSCPAIMPHRSAFQGGRETKKMKLECKVK